LPIADFRFINPQAINNQHLAIGNWQLAIGNWQLAIGN